MTLPANDHDVTKLYHEGSTDEPPAALDRAIVRAARESIAPAREARAVASRSGQCAASATPFGPASTESSTITCGVRSAMR